MRSSERNDDDSGENGMKKTGNTVGGQEKTDEENNGMCRGTG